MVPFNKTGNRGKAHFDGGDSQKEPAGSRSGTEERFAWKENHGRRLDFHQGM